MQNYAVECTCQTKLKVCVSVFDLVSWRRGQTTVAVSTYTQTLVGTTHCPSERATVSGKIDLLLRHEKTSKCTCTWYYVCFSGKFHFRFGFWLATVHHEQGQQACPKSFQHSWRKELQWLCLTTKSGMWCGARVATVLQSRGLSFTIVILSFRTLGVRASESRHSPGTSANEMPKHHCWIQKKSTIWQVVKISLIYLCFIQWKSFH